MESPPKKENYKVPVSIFEATDRARSEKEETVASANVETTDEENTSVPEIDKKTKSLSLYQFLF